MTHYTLVVFGKLGLFFQFRSQIILKENLFLHLVVSDPNPSLPSFPLFFSGWLVGGDYRYKQPAELGRGLCLSGRPVTMRKKKTPDTFVDERVSLMLHLTELHARHTEKDLGVRNGVESRLCARVRDTLVGE